MLLVVECNGRDFPPLLGLSSFHTCAYGGLRLEAFYNTNLLVQFQAELSDVEDVFSQ